MLHRQVAFEYIDTQIELAVVSIDKELMVG